jgi:HAMP domain-containing protein
MRSLLVRIFLAFWLIIAVTIGVAAISGYSYSERLREALENFEVSDSLLEASESLRSGGRKGLEKWLRNLPRTSPMNIYVIDQRGRDLLERRVPFSIVQAMRRFGDRDERSRRPPPDSDTLRPARPLTRLIDADGRVYTFFVVPNRGKSSWFNERTASYFLIFAIFLSAGVSYLLARAISNPISRFREATNAISAGNFDTRVTALVGERKDEIGHLAQDFDSMADELQRA